MTLRIGSLCTGYGGLDMAVEQFFDAEPAWFCEYDAAPTAILGHHWPDIPNHGDVKTLATRILNGDNMIDTSIDILTAGFPCQPFSAAGAREGENDERHLWPFVLEEIRALQPQFVILENVAGLRSIGGMFDEPSLRCVCGWVGRRGRVHLREAQQNGAGRGHSSPDWDGDEGEHGSRTNAPSVRRHAHHPGVGEPEALQDHNLDGERVGGREVLAGDRTPFDPEVRAGASRIEGGGDSHLAAEDRRSRSLPVDTGSCGSVRPAASAVEGVERAGEGPSGNADEVNAVCPACSRPVGDGPVGLVFRSGLGTVYRDLASIGFDAVWTSIRASDVGAPHHRERLFILAYPADTDHSTVNGERTCAEPWRRGASATDTDTDGVGCGQGARQSGTGEPEEPATVGGHTALLPTPVAQPSGNTPEDHLRKKPGRNATGTNERRGGARGNEMLLPGVAVAAATGALLPTPRAAENKQSMGSPGAARHVEAGNGGLTETLGIVLPTPTVSDSTGSKGPNSNRAGGDYLREIVAGVLPTPAACDASGGGLHPDHPGRRGHTMQLPDYVLLADEPDRWGKYAPAIRRWEDLTRPTPAPTEPNRNGKPRLNAAFAEWMMGLPAGWVTDPLMRISRVDQLKAIGNGVCPQQAYAALVDLWAMAIESLGVVA